MGKVAKTRSTALSTSCRDRSKGLRCLGLPDVQKATLGYRRVGSCYSVCGRDFLSDLFAHRVQ